MLTGPSKNIFDSAEFKYHYEMEICRFKVYIQKHSLVTPFMDKMAHWLRRWTDNPFVFARVCLNPIFVVFLMFDFTYPSSNLGKNWYLENLSHHLL